jgi:hypothetical protein
VLQLKFIAGQGAKTSLVTTAPLTVIQPIRAVAQLGSAVAAATGRTPATRLALFASSWIIQLIRAVAQLGSALEWGSRGRGFKSRRPDAAINVL